jgi:glutamate-1-semialdehyde 2,1-aminomutase
MEHSPKIIFAKANAISNKYMNLEDLQKAKHRAAQFIPSGAHTYSRANDQFPENAPDFILNAKGSKAFASDGKEYLDYGMGLFSVSLGHAYAPVLEAITRNLSLGNSFSRPSLMEGEMAERINQLIPSAEMVKFAKNGSDANAAAVRLARYFTGRDMVVRCKGQPFYSFYDWFIGSTSRPGGIPQCIRDLVLQMEYNKPETLESLFLEHPNQIACVVMEPITFYEPEDGYLQKVKDLCEKHGAVLVFDEVITGFRWHVGGAQTLYSVTPHLTTLGKGMANGFALSAVAGNREIMDAGRMDGPVFLLSCTYGGEIVGLSAGIKTIDIFENEPVIEHIWQYGNQLKQILNQIVGQI